MQGSPTGGNDVLIGGAGGTNTLVGDASTANGGPNGGADRLVSAAGTNDDMWGDFQSTTGPATGGSDTYVFSPQNGNDTIHDFEHIDTIELDGFFSNPHIPSQVASHIPPQAGDHLLQSFSDLNIEAKSGNSVITFDDNNSLTVIGYDERDAAHTLTADDFLFA